MSVLANPARAAIFSVAATLFAGLVTLPLMHQHWLSPTGSGEVRAIRVVAEGGVVKLAWSDGEKASYTVYKATDPHPFAQAEIHTVNGRTTWTDKDPSSAAIVFYRIE